MTNQIDRRSFLERSAIVAAEVGLLSLAGRPLYAGEQEPLFRISLAEWSFHRTLFAGKLDHLDFARTAKNDFGIDGIEYVNQFFKDKGRDQKYLAEMKKRASDLGVRSVLIMIDDEGAIGDPDEGDGSRR